MSQERVDELLRLVVADLVGGDRADPERLAAGLAAISRSDARRIVFSADANRFLPALGFVLSKPAYVGVAPAPLTETATRAWKSNRLRNRAIIVMAGRVQQALEAAGETPILFKGIHYLDWLWPDVGARRLQDLDLVMPGADLDRCRVALGDLGFTPIEEPTSDAIHLQHPIGLEVDLHHRFRLFESLPQQDHLAYHTPRLASGPAWRVFAPDHELATLIHHHCSNHLEVEGTRLCWIADLALRLRNAAEESPARVIELVADARRVERASWLFALIDGELGIDLSRWIEAFPPPRGRPSWAIAMASTRLLPFGLPGPRGWLRRAAAAIPAWRDRWGPRPELRDLGRLPAVVRSLSARR